MLRVNVHASYLAWVAVRSIPKGGPIITIGSVNGDRTPVLGNASYTLYKSALQGMARELAPDFRVRGITNNIVQPGLIHADDTPPTYR